MVALFCVGWFLQTADMIECTVAVFLVSTFLHISLEMSDDIRDPKPLKDGLPELDH